jgi:hypothetical protein
MPDERVITAGEVSALREAERKASRAPWSGDPQVGNSPHPDWLHGVFDDDGDWQVVILSRNALPALLATIKRMALVLDGLRASHEGYKHGLGQCVCAGHEDARALLDEYHAEEPAVKRSGE